MSIKSTASPQNDARLVAQVTGEVSIYTWRSVDIVVWDAPASIMGAREMSRALTELMSTNKGWRSSVHILTPRGGYPSDEVRAEWAHFIKQKQSRACVAVVLEMDGFRASAMRALATGLLLLSGQHRHAHVCHSLHEIARWLPAQHAERGGSPLDAGQLLRVLEEVRARHR